MGNITNSELVGQADESEFVSANCILWLPLPGKLIPDRIQ